jgi:hypothetical protein
MSVNVWDGSSIILCSLVDTCVCVGHQGHSFILFVQRPSSPSFDRRQKKKQEVKEYVPARISMSTMCACVCLCIDEKDGHISLECGLK